MALKMRMGDAPGLFHIFHGKNLAGKIGFHDVLQHGHHGFIEHAATRFNVGINVPSIRRVLPPVGQFVGISVENRIQAQRLHRNSSPEVNRKRSQAKLSFAGEARRRCSDEGLIGTDMRIAKNMLKAAVLGLLLPASARCAAVNAHCTGGVELKLSAPQASQGSLILAQVRSQKSLREVSGKWNERNVYFWEGGSSSAARRGGTNNHQSEALLGVDLEKAPGDYELSVSATTENGEHAECTATLAVRAGKFATESLTVQMQFVEPNEQQAQRAVAEQEKLRKIFDHITPEKLWHGPFRLPLTGGVRGTNFGKRRILNGQPRSPHTGADFPTPTGTPIHATQSGRVVLAEELYFSGSTVIVDHGFGIYSLYGHLSATDVAAGGFAKAGAVIAKVGATGRVTGPHLHWGVTVNKARVNPTKLVAETVIR